MFGKRTVESDWCTETRSVQGIDFGTGKASIEKSKGKEET